MIGCHGSPLCVCLCVKTDTNIACFFLLCLLVSQVIASFWLFIHVSRIFAFFLTVNVFFYQVVLTRMRYRAELSRMR